MKQFGFRLFFTALKNLEQETLQKILIIVAVLMVPILLFGKPIVFKMEQNKAKNHAVSYVFRVV